MTGRIGLDVTEVLRSPVLTGIQRVTTELIRWWPGPRPLWPVALDSSRSEMRRVSARRLRRLGQLFDAGRVGRSFAPSVIFGRPVRRHEVVCLLAPEVFHNAARTALYEDIGRSVPILAIGYDFLPQLHPEYFEFGAVKHTMWYVRWLRSLDHIAFISDRSRTDFVTRIARRDSSSLMSVPLGSDGLGRAEPAFDPARKSFVCVGTIEPRKNQAAILDAFDQLWAVDASIRLTFVGRAGPASRRLVDRIRETEAAGRLRWLQNATDAMVRELVRGARATILVSVAEGYGLPAVESLALGVPVIATGSLPSLDRLSTDGQLRIDVADADSVASAVSQFLDDGFAATRTEEISTLTLPTWRGYASSIARWVDSVVG